MKILKKSSTGPLVSFLQLTLKNLELYNGNVDKIFGEITENSVKAFQKSMNLIPDGIVGNKTWEALLPYMKVPTTIPYVYDILILLVNSLKKNYPFISTGIIGVTSMNKSIPYIKLGIGNKKILYVASTHANEWITTPLLMKFVEDYAASYTKGLKILDRYATDLFKEATIYVIPMLNPDGVNLVNDDILKSSYEYINALNISKNYPNIRFPDGWKANILGIDLNLQFPAKWEEAKKIKYEQGFKSYAPRDFVGKYPLEATEAMAIYDFILNENFDILLTYHSQGEVIYYKFSDFNPPKSLEIGKVYSSLSGYSLETTPYESSFAGLKDWFISEYNLPAYTIEVGIGVNPLPLSSFNSIYEKNIGILEITPFII